MNTPVFWFGPLALAPAMALAQVSGGAVTPVASPTMAIPGVNAGAVVSGAGEGAEGIEGAAAAAGAPAGYEGGDFVMSDHNPALWGGVRPSGKVPKHHVVRQGDTLWSICVKYYGDPWAWPQLWAHNKSITNPHGIYPGDKVRLLGGAADAVAAPRLGEEQIRITRSRLTAGGPVTFKQNAFVDSKELSGAGAVAGANSEKLMLSEADEIYLGVDDKFRPKVGKSYVVYRVKKKLEDSDGKEVGSVVEILGTAKVKRAPKGKVPTALITESVKHIERGDKLGPLRRRFKRLPAVRADRDLEAKVIGGLEDKVFYATENIVFVDMGSENGVREGQRFLVVRTGDARKRLIQDKDDPDKKWPREAVAEIAVLDPRKGVSVGLVTRALKEVKVGDRVVMRKGY